MARTHRRPHHLRAPAERRLHLISRSYPGESCVRQNPAPLPAVRLFQLAPVSTHKQVDQLLGLGMLFSRVPCDLVDFSIRLHGCAKRIELPALGEHFSRKWQYDIEQGVEIGSGHGLAPHATVLPPNDVAKRTRAGEKTYYSTRGAAAVRGPLQRQVNRQLVLPHKYKLACSAKASRAKVSFPLFPRRGEKPCFEGESTRSSVGVPRHQSHNPGKLKLLPLQVPGPKGRAECDTQPLFLQRRQLPD